MENIFTDEFLAELGYTRETEYTYTDFHGNTETHTVKPPYGRAISNFPKGMTVLQWDSEGQSCTYLKKELEPNISFAIRKDGGTRYAFNGYVFNKEQVKLLIKLTE